MKIYVYGSDMLTDRRVRIIHTTGTIVLALIILLALFCTLKGW